MNVSALIGLRYYRARSSSGFVSLVSMVSFLGLVLGVVALVVVVSVMNGFDRELKQRILGAVPHVLVADVSVATVEQALMEQPLPFAAVTPFLETPMLLVTDRGSHLMTVYGIEPALEQSASILASAAAPGAFDQLDGPATEIVLGQSIARRFGLMAGDAVNLVVPRVSTGGETVSPKLFSARMVGTVSVGSELDYRFGVMSLGDAAKLNPATPAVRITLTRIFDAPTLAAALRSQGLDASDWTSVFGDFFRTVRMEKVMMFVLLSFVVTIASFSIVSGLSMLVESKRRDIAVLRTMGLSETGVMNVFLVQGLGIALAGVGIGLLLGIPLAFYIPVVMGAVESLLGFSIVAGTYFDQIPTDVRWPDVLVIALVAFVISFAATLYPSWLAARLSPAAVLRSE